MNAKTFVAEFLKINAILFMEIKDDLPSRPEICVCVGEFSSSLDVKSEKSIFGR